MYGRQPSGISLSHRCFSHQKWDGHGSPLLWVIEEEHQNSKYYSDNYYEIESEGHRLIHTSHLQIDESLRIIRSSPGWVVIEGVMSRHRSPVHGSVPSQEFHLARALGFGAVMISKTQNHGLTVELVSTWGNENPFSTRKHRGIFWYNSYGSPFSIVIKTLPSCRLLTILPLVIYHKTIN